MVSDFFLVINTFLKLLTPFINILMIVFVSIYLEIELPSQLWKTSEILTP